MVWRTAGKFVKVGNVEIKPRNFCQMVKLWLVAVRGPDRLNSSEEFWQCCSVQIPLIIIFINSAQNTHKHENYKTKMDQESSRRLSVSYKVNG